jgi:hypothetical protein
MILRIHASRDWLFFTALDNLARRCATEVHATGRGRRSGRRYLRPLRDTSGDMVLQCSATNAGARSLRRGWTKGAPITVTGSSSPSRRSSKPAPIQHAGASSMSWLSRHRTRRGFLLREHHRPRQYRRGGAGESAGWVPSAPMLGPMASSLIVVDGALRSRHWLNSIGTHRAHVPSRSLDAAIFAGACPSCRRAPSYWC